MRIYEGNSLAEIYREVYQDMIEAPEISPKGLKTKELIAPQILLSDPRNRIAYHKDRKFSSKYALVESLLLFDKTDELKYFSKHNQNISNFSDDGEHLYGAYGKRLNGNIVEAIEKLKEDNSTRQAVLPILTPMDMQHNTKDTPCTLAIQFLIRDGYLNAITTMRSNDIIWGLPYDLFMFTIMQEVVYNELKKSIPNLKLGWYLHRPGSLHLYEPHYKLFEEVGYEFENKRIEIYANYGDWVGLVRLYKNTVNNSKLEGVFEVMYEGIMQGYENV